MNNLKSHILRFADISDEDFSSVMSFFRTVEVKKKQDLLTGGEICRSLFFVSQGCVRKFFINRKGVEQTTEFAIENWWISDTFSFQHQTASEFSIQAVEKSVVLVLDYHAQEALILKHPQMEHYFRMVYQRACAAAERRIKYLYEYSREELYTHFSAQYPWFIQRIPQYLLASFLGFTPEYLSEIRAKLKL